MNSEFPTWLAIVLAVVPLVVAVNAFILKTTTFEKLKLGAIWSVIIWLALIIYGMYFGIQTLYELFNSNSVIDQEFILTAIVSASMFTIAYTLLIFTMFLALILRLILRQADKHGLDAVTRRVEKLEVKLTSD